MNILEAKDSEPIVILKDLGWGVVKAVMSQKMPGEKTRRVQCISFLRAGGVDDGVYCPPEAFVMGNGQLAFEVLAELVDEIRSVLVDDAITKQ